MLGQGYYFIYVDITFIYYITKYVYNYTHTYSFTGLLGIYETVKKQVQIMFGSMRIIEINRNTVCLSGSYI